MFAVVYNIPFNWRRAKQNLSPTYSMPTYAELKRQALPPLSDDREANTVFLPAGTYDDPIALRDWIDEFVEGTYDLTASFLVEQRQWTQTRAFCGLRFTFDDDASCVYFRLRWEQPIELAA